MNQEHVNPEPSDLPDRLAIREEINAACNAEDNRDPMHSNEPPQVETDVVIRQLARDLPIHKSDVIKAIDAVDYSVHKLLEAQREDIVSAQGMRRLYTNYVRLASSNSPAYNPVMHTNDDGSLRMFHYDEFAKNYYWIYPLLNSIVAQETCDQLEYMNTKFNTHYEVIERERQETQLFRSNIRTNVNYALGAASSADKTSKGVEAWIIALSVLVTLEVIASIILLFTK